ncbi:MAG: pyridoxamine 5'-phosphate oxidase [SAR202 cluster bacterium]|nr:pyridoxamine 5'-phosphate oxidase [SAR202 cluster bacterium]
MTPGYGVHRGEVGLLDWDAVRERLAKARNYWVATTRSDGGPHVVPVWGLWLEKAFYFSTDSASRKGRNLAVDPRVVMHLESGDEVTILEGRAERVAEASVLGRFADAYEAKYKFRPEVSSAASSVYRVRHEAALAWEEKDFPRTATRWSFASGLALDPKRVAKKSH